MHMSHDFAQNVDMRWLLLTLLHLAGTVVWTVAYCAVEVALRPESMTLHDVL